MQPLSILITGGAGFIGSNVAVAIARQGHNVSICDVFGTGETWRYLAIADLAGLIHPNDLAIRLAGPAFDVIIHMGAISSTTERDVDLIVRTNVTLSTKLWDYCTATGARLIYASSAATYGSGSDGFDDDGSADALASLKPLNAYGWSKSVFDRYVAARHERGDPSPPQWAGLKFFNVFGPNERHKGDMRSVALKVYDQIRRGQPVTLFKSYKDGIANGGQLRDFVYVKDCVAVVQWLVDHPGVSGLFNVGTGQARSFHDVAASVFSALDLEVQIDYVDMPETLKSQYQYFTQARIDRLRAAGYSSAFRPLEEAIYDYVLDLARFDTT